MFRRPFYLSGFSCRNVPSLKFGVNVRPSHGRDCLELDCTNRLQARQKRRLRPIAGQDGAWLCCDKLVSGENRVSQVLHQNRIADAAATDIKMMNRRSSLFGRVKNGLCSIKDQMCVSHLPAFHYLSAALKPA